MKEGKNIGSKKKLWNENEEVSEEAQHGKSKKER